jgi:vancomycin permeability regulator SanA
MKRKHLQKIFIRIAAIPLAIFLFSAAVIIWDGLHDELGISDVAIVLGNKVEMDGRPSARLQARLDKTVALYQQNLFKNIIVSGGIGAEGFDEASVMKQYLTEKGIPADCIIVDSGGANTQLTAKNAAKIMREKNMQSALIISQYFHISRTRLALKEQGISQIHSSHAPFFEVRDVYSIIREVFGFYAYLFHNSD